MSCASERFAWDVQHFAQNMVEIGGTFQFSPKNHGGQKIGSTNLPQKYAHPTFRHPFLHRYILMTGDMPFDQEVFGEQLRDTRPGAQSWFWWDHPPQKYGISTYLRMYFKHGRDDVAHVFHPVPWLSGALNLSSCSAWWFPTLGGSSSHCISGYIYIIIYIYNQSYGAPISHPWKSPQPLVDPHFSLQIRW